MLHHMGRCSISAVEIALEFGIRHGHRYRTMNATAVCAREEPLDVPFPPLLFFCGQNWTSKIVPVYSRKGSVSMKLHVREVARSSPLVSFH